MEHITFKTVSYFARSDYVPINIPAPFEARPSDRLLCAPLNFGKVGPLIEDHDVVDVRDFRHVYRVVDDRYILPRGHDIGSKPWGTEMPDRTKVVVLRTYAEAYVDRRSEP